MKILPLLFLILTSCASKKLIKYPLPHLEGLSGLAIESERGEDVIFWSHTDRGPNGESPDGHKRPFMDPKFQPYWVRFSLNRYTKKVKILNKIPLGLTGLPNKASDEQPVDSKGLAIARDPKGIDPESLCFDGKNVWMGEEYGPSILKFSPEGKLLKRYFPGSGLPEKISKRKSNRGFEGIACAADKVFAMLQSPLPGDDNKTLLVEFNPVTEKTDAEYYYPMTAPHDAKIGDLTFRNGIFYVIEQNGEVGPHSFHKVYEFKPAPLITKALRLDLVKAGYDFADKVEGLSVLEDDSITVVNDNDFGVQGDAHKKTILGIFP